MPPLTPMTMTRFVEMCTARDRERAHILDTMSDTPIWLNLAGFPGVSIPMGQSPEGLPIGVQLIGRPFEDELVLAVAEQLEAARGAWQPPPL